MKKNAYWTGLPIHPCWIPEQNRKKIESKEPSPRFFESVEAH